MTPDQLAEPGAVVPGPGPGRLESGGQLYRRVRRGFALVELAHLGLLAWSIVVTQISGYDSPLWSGLPGVAAIGGAFYSLAAMVVLLLLWGLVSAAWAGVDWRREALRLKARG
jgi:hypothetical protein